MIALAISKIQVSNTMQEYTGLCENMQILHAAFLIVST